MPENVRVRRIANGIVCFEDTCHVYVVRGGNDCIAIDFGSGRWLKAFEKLGWPPIARVLLTHHHADQCAGLLARGAWPFEVHAPAGEQPFLTREGVARVSEARRQRTGFPASYSVIRDGLSDGVITSFAMAGFSDMFWGRRRIRFIRTPGHGPNALSILLDHDGKQVVFCGDAAHAGATIHQPYHLEWDHWTGGGALAAWEGIERLSNIPIDLLCPSHGPLVRTRTRETLQTLSAKLLELYRAKGSIVSGEPDHYVEPAEVLPAGLRRLSPSLYRFGMNGYLLLSKDRVGLVIDPMNIDRVAIATLLREVERAGGPVRIATATATHYHSDHVDGLPMLRDAFGASIVLHPIVAEPLRDGRPLDVPYLPPSPIIPDKLMPRQGAWRWNEYTFRVAHFPGQTWWHAGLMTDVDGRRVMFGGDSFQPASRWNGTGGFSAINGSRFREGFKSSAQRVMRWRPEMIANGHDTYVTYHRSQYQKIVRWAARAERAVKALCPSGSLEKDYYLHRAR